MQQADPVSFTRVLSRPEVLTLSFGAMIGFSWIILTDNWILEAGVGGAALAFALDGTATDRPTRPGYCAVYRR